MVSQVGLSGSTILNPYVIMGGQSATAGHLEIAPFTTIAARGGVTKSITEPKNHGQDFLYLSIDNGLDYKEKFQIY